MFTVVDACKIKINKYISSLLLCPTFLPTMIVVEGLTSWSVHDMLPKQRENYNLFISIPSSKRFCISSTQTLAKALMIRLLGMCSCSISDNPNLKRIISETNERICSLLCVSHSVPASQLSTSSVKGRNGRLLNIDKNKVVWQRVCRESINIELIEKYLKRSLYCIFDNFFILIYASIHTKKCHFSQVETSEF